MCQCPNRAVSLFYSRALESPTVVGFKRQFCTYLCIQFKKSSFSRPVHTFFTIPHHLHLKCYEIVTIFNNYIIQFSMCIPAYPQVISSSKTLYHFLYFQYLYHIIPNKEKQLRIAGFRLLDLDHPFYSGFCLSAHQQSHFNLETVDFFCLEDFIQFTLQFLDIPIQSPLLFLEFQYSSG